MKFSYILIAIGLLLIISGAIITFKYEECLSDVISFQPRECIPDIIINIAGISIFVGIGCIPAAIYFSEKKESSLTITKK